MPERSLEEVLGSSINNWFGSSTIDVHATLDAMLAVMASITVKAGCNTDERCAILANHMKANLAIQLSRERALIDAVESRATPVSVDGVEKMVAAGRQALAINEPVRVDLHRNSVPSTFSS